MSSRLRAVAPLLVATVLTLVAVFAVQHAACTDPGRYVALGGDRYVLVGGCIAPNDIVVPARPPVSADDAEAPTRS